MDTITISDLYPDIIDLYAGCGWAVGLRALHLNEVGIELDRDACRTRAAAGFCTIRGSVLHCRPPKRKGWALIASPPCQIWSSAGSRKGHRALTKLRRCLADPAWQPSETDEWPHPDCALIADLVRWIDANPEWVCLEQVPEVLPLWKALGERLMLAGYSVWVGKLNSADYGVPQTRERAILIASRVRRVAKPQPTHAEHPSEDLFGPALQPWVSMAQALGWPTTARVAKADRGTFNNSIAGGLLAERDVDEPAVTVGSRADLWKVSVEEDTEVVLNTRQRSMKHSRRVEDMVDFVRPLDEPAPTLSTQAGKYEWELHTQRDQCPDGTRQTRPASQPAPTMDTFGGRRMHWRLRGGTTSNATQRDADEPAPTLLANVGKQGGWGWTRPATTVCGDPRLGAPRHRDREGGERQFGDEAVKLTVEEAMALQSFPVWGYQRPSTTLTGKNGAFIPGPNGPGREWQRPGMVHVNLGQALLLQSFPEGFPMQGTKTSKFRQNGNAVPPLLAMHIVAEAAGIDLAGLGSDACASTSGSLTA